MSETTPFGNAAVALAAVAALGLSSLAAAQAEAPGETVTIPGATFCSWSVKDVRRRFGRPAGSTAARERTIGRNVEGATHGFDSQAGSRRFHDEFAFAGRGGTVHVIASPKDAAEARQAVVAFFVEQLKR